MASRSATTIEILPNQLLEIIFKDLSQEDIGNCSKTCVRWNEIIASVFKDQGNLNLSDLFWLTNVALEVVCVSHQEK